MFITRFGRDQAESLKRTIIAHETAHCAQHEFFSVDTAFAKLPMWVKEGSAEWLGNEIGTRRRRDHLRAGLAQLAAGREPLRPVRAKL